jgi:hypothetical protein
LGKKREAIMALYGHYNNDKREKIQKKSVEIQKIDVHQSQSQEIEGEGDIGAALLRKMGIYAHIYMYI